MKNFLQEYFHYTRSERNGLVVLTVICIALVITPTIYGYLFTRTEKTDFSQYQSQIDAFYQSKNQEDTSEQSFQLFPFDPNTTSIQEFQQLGLSEKVASTIENYRNKGGRFFKKEDFKKIYGVSEAEYERLENYIVLDENYPEDESGKAPDETEAEASYELFEFDPNTVSEDELRRLGLSPKAIKTMMNYRNKGGTFRKREDLSKIFGITEDDFERLFPYISIPEAAPTKLLASNERKAFHNEYENKAPIKIEINTATPEEWQQLRGVGSFYSQKICNFRDKLGGFISVEQVAETRGLPDSTFQKIKPFLFVNTPVKKLDLNEASAESLSAHPYLDWNQANAIVNYRKQHGSFTSVDQLENIKALDKGTLNKIKPYLDLK